MTKKIILFAAVMISIASLNGCVSTKAHQATLSDKIAIADELEKAQALLNECEIDRSALSAELEKTRELAEEREKDTADLIVALEENIVDQKISEALLSDLNSKLQEMKTNADLQEQRISDLFNKVQTSEEQATREKQIYDQLVNELKYMVDSGQAEITRLAGKTRIRLAESVLFISGKADLITVGEEVLAKIGEQLKSITDRRIMIEGHTDSVPIGKTLQMKYPSNLELSAARAVVVHQFLRSKNQISANNLAVVAYGPYQPIDTNETEEGRQKNRRVVLALEPIDNQGSK
jgi:chemotaxis protein MotB